MTQHEKARKKPRMDRAAANSKQHVTSLVHATKTLSTMGRGTAPRRQQGDASRDGSIWSRVLSTPRAVMALVPLLVLVLGITLTLIGQLALSATSKKMARARFIDQSANVALRVEQALARADPVLDELVEIAKVPLPDSSQGLHAVAARMKNLLIGRSALTQAYFALPDGRFVSVDHTSGELQDPSRIAFQVTESGQSRSYAILATQLVLERVSSSNYDPRVRDWYKLAKKKKERVWSAPYLFFFNRHPGVTRARPLYTDHERQELQAIVGVDIDVSALTEFLAAAETGTENAKSVVFSSEGVVLAYPRAAKELASLPVTGDIPTYSALNDPELSALVEHVLALPDAKRSQETVRFAARGLRMMGSVRRLSLDGPHWYVASFATEESVFSELYTYRRRSLAIGGLALIFAMAFGWFLARAIFHVKRQVIRAEERAERAQEQVRDLGSYRLISRIGEGGMGQVWRARHRLLAREAAVKLIKLGDDSERRSEEQRERFRREAQAIASLRSRHTVALFDYGVTDDGTLFYAMELLDGLDLSSLVSRFGPQPPARVRQILLQACSSLMEAHAAGLVHRDIKPANLFVCREAEQVDVVKVLDFGLVFQVGAPRNENEANAATVSLHENSATLERDEPRDLVATAEATQVCVSPEGPVASSSLGPHISVDLVAEEVQARITHPHHQIGTPAFMSPEQALGHSPDHRSDLYSLGCVAWWLLTGSPVFQATSQLALMVKHIEEKPAQLTELAPEVGKELGDLIMRMLSKSPQDRPQSASELAAELKAVRSCLTWTEDQAQHWWATHLPPPLRPTTNLTLPPMRDAEFVRIDG